MSVRQARVGLELRQRRYIQVEELYRSFLEDSSLTNEARNFYSWRYAKFSARVCENTLYVWGVGRGGRERERERERLHTSIDHGSLCVCGVLWGTRMLEQT